MIRPRADISADKQINGRRVSGGGWADEATRRYSGIGYYKKAARDQNIRGCCAAQAAREVVVLFLDHRWLLN